MSTDGTAKVMEDALDQAKALVAQGRQEAEQLNLLADVTPEEMIEAREALGPGAGKMAVLREARRRGRPKNARNKRTDDFARYLLQHGQHPAITMMQIQATAPEVLIENSRRTVMKVLKGGKDRDDKVVEVVEETLTYEAAQSLRIRCAEGLLPYIESKRPVAVDMNFSGLSDLIIAGVTHSDAEVQDVLDADFTSVDDEGEGDV
jgi:hypothetical protein